MKKASPAEIDLGTEDTFRASYVINIRTPYLKSAQYAELYSFRISHY